MQPDPEALAGGRPENELRRSWSDPPLLWADLAVPGEEQWRFDRLVAILDEVFYVVDSANDRVVYISPAFERIWGIPVSVAVEQPLAFLDAVHPEDRERVRESLAQSRAGVPMRIEYRIRRPDGTTRWIWDRNSVVSGPPGQPSRKVGLATDVTDLHNAQVSLTQMQRLEALGHLGGGLAHDFNNILTVILASLQRAAGLAAPGSEVSACIDGALAAVMRGREITGSLLSFARQRPLRRRRFDLNCRLSATMPLLRQTAGPGVRVELSPSGRPLPVLADSGGLESVLINLVANARDAMPDGGRVLVSSCEHRLGDEGGALPVELMPGDYALGCVQDEGHGMTEAVLERAIEPLFTTKPEHKGTGLGLSMAYGMLRRHGGTLTLQSALGQGTRVMLYLPIEAVEETLAASAPVRPAASATAGLSAPLPAAAPAGGDPKSVLAVEDDAALRELITVLLQEAKIDVRAVPDAAAARRCIEADRFDLLITDLQLPGEMDGRSLGHWARSRQPGLRVLLVTGSVTATSPGEPGWGLLAKPFDAAELVASVRAALQADSGAPPA